MLGPQFQTLLQYAGERCVFKDLRQVITAASQSFRALCGVSGDSSELVGRTGFDVLPDEVARLHDRLEREVLAGAPSAHEFHATRDAQGRARWTEACVHPVCDEAGQLLGLLTVERDLTEDEATAAQIIAATEPSNAPQPMPAAGRVPSETSPERIRQGIAVGEFLLYYQPCVNMSIGKVIAAEALLRWQHPELGLLAAADFLPAVHDHPYSIELGEWVIDTVLAQMEQWLDAGLDLPVSVNVGARHLQSPDFADRLREIVTSHPRIRPARLQLEILESSVPRDVDLLARLLRGCRELGVTFALDDFGSNPSSLNDLRQSPASVLKIDPGFIRDILEKPEDLCILEGILCLASSFRRQFVAEGVESADHGLMLLRMGCALGQGYGIASPMPASELPEWAAHWRPDPRWAEASSVPVDERPLLYAGAEHRAWITAIEAYLRQETAVQPPMNRHQCHFGAWLDFESQGARATHPEFQAVVALHWRLHALATGIVKLYSQGKAEEGLARVPELYTLQEKMVQAVQALTSNRRASPDEPPLIHVAMTSTLN